jgi:uncharacterized protein (DUF111 family)
VDGRRQHRISEQLILLQTNIDDASPQILGFVMERLLTLGERLLVYTDTDEKKPSGDHAFSAVQRGRKSIKSPN